jgi:hypothetical protein
MNRISRRSFAAGVTKSVALAGTMMQFAGAADAQVVWSPIDWRLADFNRLLSRKGEIKQVFDITSVSNSLDKVKNSLNGLQVGFGIPAAAIQTVAGLHGPANFLNFTDVVWQKYPIAQVFGIRAPDASAPASRNMHYDSPFPAGVLHGDPSSLDSPWHDVSMEGLRRRGVTFLGCHTALEFQVRQLKQEASLSAPAEEIVRDMLQHLVPGSLMVVSMVSAFAMLQAKGSYAYIKT